MESHSAVDYVGILACTHKLLERVMPLWMSLLKGASSDAVEAMAANGLADEHKEYVDTADQGPDAYMKDGQMDWVAYNAKQRGTALRLAKRQPEPYLVVARCSAALPSMPVAMMRCIGGHSEHEGLNDRTPVRGARQVVQGLSMMLCNTLCVRRSW